MAPTCQHLVLSLCLATASPVLAGAVYSQQEVPIPLLEVEEVPMQPLRAQALRLQEALAYLGQPLLNDEQSAALQSALSEADPRLGTRRVQQILDPHCLAGVDISPESRVKVEAGSAAPLLVEQGWATFLVKVRNQAGVSAALQASSRNAGAVYAVRPGAEVTTVIRPQDIEDRWMDLQMINGRPLNPRLSGLLLEYRILQVYSRDPGAREGQLAFHVGQGTQDIGFRNEVSILFRAAASVPVTLHIRDHDGSPVMAGLVIRDARGRIYPSQAKRLAPDFFFHPQVYRADGETVTLPPGEYTVVCTRGPEYLPQTQTLRVDPKAGDHSLRFDLVRWVHPAALGWYSGDHHVHAAGCAHYSDPTQGVGPEDMNRHILGENLDVGCILSWGPCWYFQKGFFDGGVHPLSSEAQILRYDVEVSGFPSDYAGHLCLLGLSEDDFPGTKRIEEWPSWDLPILQWARSQGAVTGFAHSGWGLETRSTQLPNLEIPPFTGIGANEYIVDVTHDVVDFISTVDTPWPWELNIWYHTNNAGFRTRISGETDFPCIYGERVGLGRSYVKIDEALNWDSWLHGIQAGRSYVSDGRSHLIGFRAGERKVGEDGSELRLESAGSVTIEVDVTALLAEKADPSLRGLAVHQKPYWHLERSRIGASRTVPVEIIVNGEVAQSFATLADGTTKHLSVPITIERSSWVAVRIPFSAHTNPIYILVDGQAIRASKESIQWCLDSVEQCWRSKSGVWRQRFAVDPAQASPWSAKRLAEFAACETAYDFARQTYRRRLEEFDQQQDG